jgi:GT2 family glycosyltransferase
MLNLNRIFIQQQESMKLSIVIVNYNVRYFLEQCLHSVKKALNGLSAEVFVVDNNSVDGSVEMLNERFPEIITIANKENLGFSRANNQAIRLAKGEYVLLLNPDTVVEDNTFRNILQFMDEHPDAGGLGVKMVDGNGKFLPESKRGLPTPAVAFYKIFGFSRLFPRSRVFGRYHLGYLDNEETHPVEILSGAFMLLRKSVLDEIGLLDETFFMYGEDIDLSYRIIKAGYKNYYYPGARIIHYKGESTKKGSLNYVLVFYNAMVIFARKHFTAKNARLFSLLINLAVYFRAILAIFNRFFSRIALPFADAVLLFGGLYEIKIFWEHNVVFTGGGKYPDEVIAIAIPFYILVWLYSVFLSGGYDRPVHLLKIFRGLFIGTIFILTIYSLLPEHLRFSRALILLGAIWGLISMSGLRYLLHLFKVKGYHIGGRMIKRFVIIGDKIEAERVAELIRRADMKPGFIGLVSVSENPSETKGFIGHLGQIKDIINIYKIDVIIFCAKDLPAQQIIDYMSELSDSQLEFKIAPPESLSIIGSKSINTIGDVYIIDLNSITKTHNRRSKRFLDIITSFALIIISPVAIFLVRRPAGLFRNVIQVIAGKKSWVGYRQTEVSETHKLPAIKKGVLNPTDQINNADIPADAIYRLNLLYVRDYKPMNDINIILKGFRNLGR